MKKLIKKTLDLINTDDSANLLITNGLLISFPRSGNHLVRMIIEYASSRPTHGCLDNPNDTYICENEFLDYPDILKHVNAEKKPILRKAHNVPRFSKFLVRKRVFIFRDWKECITSHVPKIENCDDQTIETWCKLYISLVSSLKSSDLVISYNKILKKDKLEISRLLDYLNIKDSPQRQSLFENIDMVYKCSSNGKNRSWGGVNSLGKENYYNKKYPELQSRISKIMISAVEKSGNSELSTLLFPYDYSRVLNYAQVK